MRSDGDTKQSKTKTIEQISDDRPITPGRSGSVLSRWNGRGWAKAHPARGRQSFAGKHGPVRTLFDAFLIGVCLNAAVGAEILFQEPIVLESPNAQGNGRFGAEGVAWVPDVNGDGIPEIVVGALGESTGASPFEAGRAYVFDGATREVLTELKSPNEVARGNFGWRVEGIADLNGNGSGDVIVATGSGESRVYVFDGATGAVIYTFNGRGNSVSSVSDVNDDGLPDIVVGNHVNPNSLGYARIYDGASGALLRTINAPAGAFNFFGWSVSGVPDTNGNGGGDVVVGNWGHNGEQGRAYIYDGTTGNLLHTLNPTLAGSGQFGRSVAGLGDINGDGRGDVIIGAAGVSGNAAYIIDGATGTELLRLSDPVGNNGLSWTVAALPDVTGDGLSDVVVSGFIPASLDNAYLFDASTGAHLATLPGSRDFGGGESMTGIPDLNGDGKGEVLVGNHSGTSSEGHGNAGHVLLYLSKPLPTPPSLQVVGIDDQSFRLTVSRDAGSDTTVEGTSDFLTWETVATIAPGTGPAEVEDSEASNHRQRFYRAVQKD
jgi:WD40 repeat protein